MVRALNRHGWDAVVWNFRGCSGEPNRKVRFYHSGDTQDLHTVLTHALQNVRYEKFALIGFSLGGNVILKYLGEQAHRLNPKIRSAVTFSVPCDLAGSAREMARFGNALYMKRFMGMLHEKVRAKMKLFPGRIDDRGFLFMRTFKDFDERYTAPLHGFTSAEDYWEKSSSKPLLGNITVPTLLVNALDDPFLASPCYPYREAQDNPHLFLETPKTGGHVGFISFNKRNEYWSESRAMKFLGSHV
jgi:predicted alpha/beta-fold hydrolase